MPRPLRVLHLVDALAPESGPSAVHLLGRLAAQSNGMRHEMVVLGGRQVEAIARDCDAAPRGRLAPLRGLPCPDGLRRLLRRSGGSHDLVHAWDSRAGLLAARAAPPGRCLITLGAPPEERLLEHLLRRRPRPLAAPTATARRRLAERGLDRAGAVVVAPAVDAAALSGASRAALRSGWGVGEDVLLVAPAGRASPEAMRRLVTAVHRLHHSDRRIALLADPHAPGWAEIERFVRLVGAAPLLRAEPRLAEPWRVAPAIDVVTWLGGPRSAFAVLWAMAAGVATVIGGAEHGDLVEPQVEGLAADGSGLNAICAALMRLHDDRDLARRLGDAARQRALEHHGVEAFAERLEAAYRQLGGGRA